MSSKPPSSDYQDLMSNSINADAMDALDDDQSSSSTGRSSDLRHLWPAYCSKDQVLTTRLSTDFQTLPIWKSPSDFQTLPTFRFH